MIPSDHSNIQSWDLMQSLWKLNLPGDDWALGAGMHVCSSSSVCVLGSAASTRDGKY